MKSKRRAQIIRPGPPVALFQINDRKGARRGWSHATNNRIEPLGIKVSLALQHLFFTLNTLMPYSWFFCPAKAGPATTRGDSADQLSALIDRVHYVPAHGQLLIDIESYARHYIAGTTICWKVTATYVTAFN